MKQFNSEEHKADIEKLNSLWSALHDLEVLAKEYGIDDLFQDNGAKILQQLILLNFDNLPGREGNDAVSASGTEWEMKSINIATSATGFSTNHHFNEHILTKYRQVPWSFAIYNNLSLEAIYIMKPEQLEPLFTKWEDRYIKNGKEGNNPKIPLSFVKEKGLLVYPYPDTPIDPDSINNKDES
jgi:hypothetical protein